MTPHNLDSKGTADALIDQLRRIGRQNSAVRTTRPDWRLGRAPASTDKQKAKARRRQAAESRKRNR